MAKTLTLESLVVKLVAEATSYINDTRSAIKETQLLYKEFNNIQVAAKGVTGALGKITGSFKALVGAAGAATAELGGLAANLNSLGTAQAAKAVNTLTNLGNFLAGLKGTTPDRIRSMSVALDRLGTIFTNLGSVTPARVSAIGGVFTAVGTMFASIPSSTKGVSPLLRGIGDMFRSLGSVPMGNINQFTPALQSVQALFTSLAAINPTTATASAGLLRNVGALLMGVANVSPAKLSGVGPALGNFIQGIVTPMTTLTNLPNVQNASMAISRLSIMIRAATTADVAKLPAAGSALIAFGVQLRVFFRMLSAPEMIAGAANLGKLTGLLNAIVKFSKLGPTGPALLSALKLPNFNTELITVQGNLYKTSAASAGTATVLGRLRQQFRNVTGAVLGMNQSLSTMRLTIAGFSAFAIYSFSRFDTDLSRAMVRLADYAQTSREIFRSSTFNVAARSITSPSDLAGALGTLSASGMNAVMAAEALAIAETHAVAGSMDLHTSTRQLVGIMNAFGLSTDNTSEHLRRMTNLSDMLVRSTQLVDVTTQEMGDALGSRFLAVLRESRRPLEEGIALLGVFADAEIRGAAAGDQAARFLSQLQMARVQHQQVWRTIFPERDIFDAEGRLRNIADVLEIIEQQQQRLSPQRMAALFREMGFEQRTIQAVLRPLGFSNTMRDIIGELQRVGSAAESSANLIRNSFGSQLMILWNNIRLIAIEVGNVFVPVLGWLIARIRDFSGWFRSLNPQFRAFIVWLSVGLTSIPLLGMAVTVLGTVLGIAATGFSALAASLGIVFSTIGVAVVTFGAIGAIITTILGGWGTLGNLMLSVWNGVIASVGRVGAGLSDLIGFFINLRENSEILFDFWSSNNQRDLNSLVQTVMVNMLHNVREAVRLIMAVFVWLQNNIGNIWEDLKTITNDFLISLTRAFEAAANVIGRVLEAVFTSIASTVVREGIDAIGRELVNGLRNLGPEAIVIRNAREAGGLAPADIRAATQERRTRLIEFGTRQQIEEAAAGNMAAVRRWKQIISEAQAANRPGEIMREALPNIQHALAGGAPNRFRTQPFTMPETNFRGALQATPQQLAALAGMVGLMPAGLGGVPFAEAARPFGRPNLNLDWTVRSGRMDPRTVAMATTAALAGLSASGGLGTIISQIAMHQAVRANLVPGTNRLNRPSPFGGSDEALQVPGGRSIGHLFEQLSFNRFMIGGPEIARIEQQVSDTKLQSTAESIREVLGRIETNTREMRPDVMGPPRPAPVVLGH